MKYLKEFQKYLFTPVVVTKGDVWFLSIIPNLVILQIVIIKILT